MGKSRTGGFKLPATTSRTLLHFFYIALAAQKTGKVKAISGNAKIKRIRAVSFCGFGRGWQKKETLTAPISI